MHNLSNRSRDEVRAYVAAPAYALPAVDWPMEAAMASQPLLLQMLGIGAAGCVPARQRSYSVPIGAPVTGRCHTGIGGKTNMSNLSNADYDRQNVPIAERVFGRGVTIDVKRQGKGQYSATLRTGIGGSSRRFVQPMSKGAWYAGVGAPSPTVDPWDPGQNQHCIEHIAGTDCYEKQANGTWIRVSTTPASSSARPGGIRLQASGQHLGGAPVHTRGRVSAGGTAQGPGEGNYCPPGTKWFDHYGGCCPPTEADGPCVKPITYPTRGGSPAGRDDWAVTFPTKRNVTPSKTQVRAIAATGRKISATTLARGY